MLTSDNLLGLINAHMHLSRTRLHGIADDVEVGLRLRLSLEVLHETASLVTCFQLLPVHS